MRMFSRKRVVGTMSLDFTSETAVAVTDDIPDSDGEVCYPVWFAFFYAGKLLANFPPPSGRAVVQRALSVLDGLERAGDPLAYKRPMLEICCADAIAIIPTGGAARWTYSAELFYKGDDLAITTQIAPGLEDHFHRAAIDVVFEVMRRRLGEGDTSLITAAHMYFSQLHESGCDNVLRNLDLACAASAMASVMWSQAQSGEV